MKRRRKKVTVRLLATFQDLLPSDASESDCVFEVAAGETAEAVLSKLNVPTDNSSVILVNGLTPEPDQELEDGDVVCAFPAIAGG
jgi:molybdopterin converting factor small subunit